MNERARAAVERMRAAKACPEHLYDDAPEAHWYGFGGPAGTPSAPCDDCAARVLHAGVGKVTEAAESSAIAAYARKERSPSWTVKECIVAAVRGALAAMIGEPPETER